MAKKETLALALARRLERKRASLKARTAEGAQSPLANTQAEPPQLTSIIMGLQDPDSLSANQRYFLCEALISEGKFHAAETLLLRRLERNPEAAQSVYLLGITLLLQGRLDAAQQMLDHAYALKGWVKDFRPEIYDIRPVLRSAIEVRPEWTWARYELQRRAFIGVGLTFKNVAHKWLSHDEVFFIEIGANDGRRGDQVLPLAQKYGWRGLLVEPQPEAFRRLRKTYEGNDRVQFANVAIGERDETRTLYFDPDDRLTLASFVPSRNLLRKVSRLEGVEVQAVTLSTLFKMHPVPDVHILQIDTEGYDYQILKGWDFDRYRPILINMEYYCLPVGERLEAVRLLRRAGYAWRFHKMDLIAVDRKTCEADLAIIEVEAEDFATNI